MRSVLSTSRLQAAMRASPGHHFIAVEGIGKVHYVAAGQGPPLVLLHPLAGSVIAWRYNIPCFSERYAVFAPDLPGHGESDASEARYDLESGVHFVLRFLDGLGLERVTFVGSSTGGLLALATALRHPERTQALVLVGAAGLGREVAWPLRLASLPGIGRFLDTLDVLAGGRFGGRLFHRPELVDTSVRREIVRLRRRPATRKAMLITLRHGVNLMGLRPTMLLLQHGTAGLQVPTLVVWGECDRIIPAVHARRLASIAPHIRVHILPDCGHWPQMEQAQAFNTLVKAFLEDALGPGRGAGNP